MSETGFKAVTLDLKSPWVRNADRITYAVAGSFDAAPATPGIYVLPTLDAAVSRAKRFGLVGPWGNRARYLEVSYELADVYEETGEGLGVAAVTVVTEVT